ncbi:MAG: hypothetical protein A3I77_08650 [Gammaproteobacteria bacterium RIFCSPLOWO2_02_FULL_42_14]|nr:MAG: hypothetical protein A3B71_00330 [Gammaproteobacteria bacterium RIFCSPHIGHO2_02_FULL_42_43]OGT28856.1 MAG: hypothetical protein A2624_04405 [Gammaproteobacteria bacterium RIFCSPHIGHO2_01_FULL_42_8]OGT50980.1 MAG: hypothetical protein A3E54_00160 [Gammaproteobacteria bacterium RIFCSPHIGHO2_12_FULL_41_25]OGT63046.1 MAG: hypothetical protein A3I77_08650 [Gammaproteobacteria bacterium RIFCSPLOWO2_02_FULL_42_14]OGT85661.1 MAG: hypothetical protein A3G86_00160 [Gammaproteobacteria bacterium R
MKKVILTFVSAAALATVTAGMAASANAMDSSSYSSNDNGSAAGLFVSGDLGMGTLSDTFQKTTQKVSGNFAWAINAGYQFNKYLAAEVGYISFLDQNASLTANGATVKSGVSLGGFDFNAKGIIPITDKFSVFAKGGMMDMSSYEYASGTPSTSASVWTPDLGAGAAYNLTRNVALSVQAIHAFQKNFTKDGVKQTMPGATAYLAGVSYKFSV